MATPATPDPQPRRPLRTGMLVLALAVVGLASVGTGIGGWLDQRRSAAGIMPGAGEGPGPIPPAGSAVGQAVTASSATTAHHGRPGRTADPVRTGETASLTRPARPSAGIAPAAQVEAVPPEATSPEAASAQTPWPPPSLPRQRLGCSFLTPMPGPSGRRPGGPEAKPHRPPNASG